MLEQRLKNSESVVMIDSEWTSHSIFEYGNMRFVWKIRDCWFKKLEVAKFLVISDLCTWILTSHLFSFQRWTFWFNFKMFYMLNTKEQSFWTHSILLVTYVNARLIHMNFVLGMWGIRMKPVAISVQPLWIIETGECGTWKLFTTTCLPVLSNENILMFTKCFENSTTIPPLEKCRHICVDVEFFRMLISPLIINWLAVINY